MARREFEGNWLTLPRDLEPHAKEVRRFQSSEKAHFLRQYVMLRMRGRSTREIGELYFVSAREIAGHLRQCGMAIPTTVMGGGGFMLSAHYARYLGLSDEELRETGAKYSGGYWWSRRWPADEERDERRLRRFERRWQRRRRFC